MDVNLRFRVTQAYATRSGFVGGVPSFFTATYPDKIVFGSLLISQLGAQWHDVPISILHPKNPDDFVSLVKDVMTYAKEWGYEAGFPTFFRGVATDLETTFGTILFKPGNVTIQYIPSSSFDGIAQDDIGGRFRMVQQIATKAGFVGGFPTFVQEERLITRDDGSVYRGLTDAVVMLPDGTATFRDLPKEGLSGPNLDDPAQHVRSMQARATEDGFVGAIPTFFTAESGGFVCGTLLLDAQAAEWRDVPVNDLGNPPSDDQPGRFRASQGYADREGFVGAFPTFYEAEAEIHRTGGVTKETVNGTILVKSPSEWRDVRSADLGNPPDDDGPARFRATQVYAGANGAIGGFPNFNQLPGGPNQEMLYGTILLKGPGVTFRDVNYKELFTGGIIRGAIWDHWQALGGPAGFLGLPLTEELTCIDGVGKFNRFDNGSIFYSPVSGAWEVHGAILDHWNSLGAERSYLGYPASDEGDYTDASGTVGRVSYFQYGKIIWLNGVASDVPDSVLKHADVYTPAGTALGGHVDLTLFSNGNYTQAIYMHDSGAIGYDFDVHYIFSTPHGLVLTDHWAGHVGGSLTPGSSDFNSSQPLHNPMIQKFWVDVNAKDSKLDTIKDYSPTGVGGFIISVAKAIFDVGATAAGLTLGVIIGTAEVLGSLLPSFGPGETLGIIDGVVVFALGGGIVMAVIQGVLAGAVTDAMIKTREVHPPERDFADKVFSAGQLNYDNIRITNLARPGGRQFTVRGTDGLTYVNMGSDAYDNPTAHIAPNTSQVAGEVFIHELTHAWQIQHAGLDEIVICRGFAEGADDFVGQDVYTYAPSADWTDYGIEQQASIVQDWFNGSQTGSIKADENFRYIRDNIRKGND